MPEPKSYWSTKDKVAEYYFELFASEADSDSLVMISLKKLIDAKYPLNYERMIDLGCGPGNVSSLILQEYPFKNLVAIDLSDAMLDEVPWFVDIETTRTTLQRADVCSCRFDAADNSTDFVFASRLVSYLPSIDNLMEESFRVLKQGGLLLFSTLVHTDPVVVSYHCQETKAAMPLYAHSKLLIEKFIDSLGFTFVLPNTMYDVEDLISIKHKFGLFALSKK